MGAEHAAAVFSCTSALHLSLIVNDIGDGDEVITTPLTFCATANAIIHSGAKPVFVDVNRQTMNIDVNAIEAKITEKTKAIMPVHFAGRPCNMDRINQLAAKYKLKVIEDAAHALGSAYKGKMIGSGDNLTCFSFYATKNITTAEGGMVVSNNKELIDKIKVYALHGMSKDAWKRYKDDGYKHYQVIYPGFKYNMTDLQASLGLHQIKKIDRFNTRRNELWKLYTDNFKALPLILPARPEEDTVHAQHLFPVLIDQKRAGISRDEFMYELHKQGIGTGVHFVPVHLHQYYTDKFGFKAGDYPNAEYIGERTVSLPFSPKLSDADVKRVIKTVADILKVNR